MAGSHDSMITSPKALAKHALKIKTDCPRLFEAAPHCLSDFSAFVQEHYPRLWRGLFAQGEDIFRDELLNVHAAVWWEHSGLPVFRVTEDLLAGLLMTDSGNVPTDDIHFPFNTFALTLPPAYWSFQGLDGNTHPVAMVLIHNYKAPIDFDGGRIRRCLMISIVGRDGTLLWDRVTWPRNTFAGWFNNEDVSYVTTVDASEQQLQLVMRRVVINLAMYVAERGKGKKHNKPESRRQKKRSIKRRAKFIASSDLEVWTLGHEIKLSRELIEAARQSVSVDTGDRERWTISRRSVTRGHRKRQAYGPKHSLRKWIWVEPYWRGPVQGERIAHLYTGGSDDG